MKLVRTQLRQAPHDMSCEACGNTIECRETYIRLTWILTVGGVLDVSICRQCEEVGG